MIAAVYPLNLVRAALMINSHSLRKGYPGPSVCVRGAHPALHFCIGPQERVSKASRLRGALCADMSR